MSRIALHSSPADAARPGMRIGNYLLEARIGMGGFAEVWKAVHHERRRGAVAVKIGVRPEMWRRLRHEGRLADFDHPNIVPILDSDTRFEGAPYLVMPLYPGTLAGEIAAQPRGLDEAQVRCWLEEILAGLAAAHARRIVHNDVKPANVLIDAQRRAAVGDFGLSTRDERDEHMSADPNLVMQSASLDAPQAERLAGTLAYLAPEVRAGVEATPAADVFAVGVLLFEMLTGRRPGPLELPSQCRAGLRDTVAWDALYLGACREVSNRFADASRMLAALRMTLPAVGVDAADVHGCADANKAAGTTRPMLAVAHTSCPAGTTVGHSHDAHSGAIAPKLVSLVEVPATRPAPENEWEALLQRWSEWRDMRHVLQRHAEAMSTAAQMYSRSHPQYGMLQTQEALIRAELELRKRATCAVAERILESVRVLVAAPESRRRQMLEGGCFPRHPEVQRLSQAIGPLMSLRYELSEFLDEFERSSFAECVDAWQAVRHAKRSAAFRLFLREFGTGPENPWAAAAMAALRRARIVRNCTAVALAGAAITALVLWGFGRSF